MQLSVGSGEEVTQAINLLFREQFPESEVMNALFLLMEGDLTHVKSLARFMKMDTTNLAGLLGCISGDPVALDDKKDDIIGDKKIERDNQRQQYKPFIEKLARKLGIKRHHIVKDMLMLSAGDCSAVHSLNVAMKEPLTESQSHTIRSMVFLINFSRKNRKVMRNQLSRTNLLEQKVDIFELSEHCNFVANCINIA